MRLVGTATVNPLNAKFTVDGQDIELLPFQNYMGDKVNLSLTGGQIGSKGELSLNTAADGGMRVNYQGSVRVADFGSVEKNDTQDLLKWKSLALDAIQFDLEPFQLRIGEITLADFYSRLILGADGKMNLQKLTAQTGREKRRAGRAGEGGGKTARRPSRIAAAPKAITIGKINLQGGNVNFSDFFVKPNYSANLTGVQGTISELKPETPGDIDLTSQARQCRAGGHQRQDQPALERLFLDIIADATGYRPEPDVALFRQIRRLRHRKRQTFVQCQYKIENRKLTARKQNHSQPAHFRRKNRKSDATKLPVLLAVALLKDRNGVIDINLPIGGSLDDPQFSVGGIVWQIIVNILAKAVTAPFALLGSVFGGGGGGEELSYIEFDYGRAASMQRPQRKSRHSPRL